MRKILLALIAITVLQTAFTEEKTKDFHIMPILNYEYLRFQEQRINSPGEGIILAKGNLMPLLSEDRNSLMISGILKQYFVSEIRDEYAGLYHNISLIAEKKMKRHLLYGNLSSQAVEPFYGGLHTFTAIFGYANEFIRNKHISLTAGGVFLVTDFGMELPNGIVWPIMPMPLFRFSAETSFMDIYLEFMGNILMDFTFLPESKIRVTSHLEVNPFIARDIRDLFIDTVLWYRFYSKESRMGDFAGIGLGFKNSGLGLGMVNSSFSFNLPDNGRSYEINFYSVYGILDLSFLKLSSGYSFDGREIYDGDKIKKIGNGFFINVLLIWQLGW